MKRKNYPWELPPEIEARLGETTYGPQRAIYEAGHLLIVLHSPPGIEDMERDVVVFWRKPNGEHWYNGCDGGEARLRSLLQGYRTRWEECEELFEAADSASALFAVLEILVPISRSATNLANALQTARELVKKDKFLIGMRDEAHEVARAYELLMADAKHSVDYRMARHAEAQAAQTGEMTRAQHKLNILAALTFPMMAFATLFGMNLQSGLEESSLLVFWGVLVAAFLIGFAIKSWVVRERTRD